MSRARIAPLALTALLSLASTAALAQVPYAAAYPNEAWKVSRGWDDVTPEAGLAWDKSSGLTWQQKYSKWVQGMRKIQRLGESGFTFEVTTPYANGKVLPAPVADCADTAMLLRITFASWYGLPVLVKAGGNFYGHFGVRKGSAATASIPLCSGCDFSGKTAQELNSKPWPTDKALHAKVVGPDDQQPAIGGGGTGAYLDALLLNKRAGHVIVRLLNDAGSSSLAGSINLYDIQPKSIQAGDVLIERWQAQGIGHTIVIKSVEAAASGAKLKVEVAAGWLPARQALIGGSVEAHGDLSDAYFGSSECVDATCAQTYAMFGGGIKRWRAPHKVNGKWELGVLAADKEVAILPAKFDPTGKPGKAYWDALGHRTDEFEELIYLPPPAELRDELLKMLSDNRAKLRAKPSGCAAREHREDVFAQLYDLMRKEFHTTREQTDALYRKTEDYLFAPLDYTKSATCCWNGSSPEMGESAVKAAIQIAKQKVAAGSCEAPAIFRRSAGDYQPYKSAAVAAGVVWKPWANDERCPAAQVAVAEDPLKSWTVVPFCTVQPFTRE